MSAPDTNVKEQEAKHKPSLFGIRLVVVFAGVMLLGLLSWQFIQADGPEGADVQVRPGVGTVEAD